MLIWHYSEMHLVLQALSDTAASICRRQLLQAVRFSTWFVPFAQCPYVHLCLFGCLTTDGLLSELINTVMVC